MGKLFEQIRSAVGSNDFVAWHADERCEERGITAWQLVAGLEKADLIRELAEEQTESVRGGAAIP